MIIASGTGEIEVIGLTISLEPGDMMYAEANVLTESRTPAQPLWISTSPKY
jgi:hypothetical protein